MAWTDLPTNYTDAIWSGLKRYTQINNSDGTVSFRDDTEYTNRESSFFGADDANKMNGALNSIMSYLKSDSAGAHNAIYRGKFLGNSVTAEQYAEIAAGTFNDLYIGDYWTIGNRNYRVAAFDYLINFGDNNDGAHHVVVVPDVTFGEAQMNETMTVSGGYVGSKLYTEGLENAKTVIKAAFPNHVWSHRLYLTNAVDGGYPSACAWCTSEVDLMCEQMLYGGPMFMAMQNGNTSGGYAYANGRVEMGQLPLFTLAPQFIVTLDSYWLRDVVNSEAFAVASKRGGVPSYTSANQYASIRPYFCIKG